MRISVIMEVPAVRDRTVELELADGSIRVVDLTPFLRGSAFADIAEDNDLFARRYRGTV